MATVNIYLTFNGNCEEAFNFYKTAFEVEISYMGRYKDMSAEDSEKMKLKGGDEEKIMHVTLPISKETMVMGCDAVGEWASAYSQGNNFSISVNTGSKQEAERIFKGLSDGGTITMPLSKTFWSECFGMLTDKFGISWMISFN
jgi:PhnB protein